MPSSSRRRWYQFSLRTLFVVVTLAAIVSLVWSWMAQRRDDFVEKQRYHAGRLVVRINFIIDDGSEFARRDEAVALFNAYHQAMAEKYNRAARFPWLPVEPDPPEPPR